MDPAIYLQRVEARMRRQQILERADRPRYHVLLDEAVLHRHVGGPRVMAAQIDKVLEAGRQGKVVIQVIPFNAGVPPAQDSNFVLLEFTEDSNLSPIVFVEGLAGNQYLERQADIGRYREAIEYLQDSALSRQDSIPYLSVLREPYVSK
jgi:Domain of unknown function (DUF5753)